MEPENEFIPETDRMPKDLMAFEAYLSESRDHYRRLADRAANVKECTHYANLAAYYTRLLERFRQDGAALRQSEDERQNFFTGRYGSRVRIRRGGD